VDTRDAREQTFWDALNPHRRRGVVTRHDSAWLGAAEPYEDLRWQHAGLRLFVSFALPLTMDHMYFQAHDSPADATLLRSTIRIQFPATQTCSASSSQRCMTARRWSGHGGCSRAARHRAC